ncbi:hypothetical protein KEM55_001802 [Ascosphaera atra]|nr:hypothetical protein KEM55_001802 [Ascosphaera atra]
MQQQTNGVASDHHAHAHPPTSFNGTSFVNGIGNGNPSIFFYGTNLTNGTGEAPTNGTNGEPRTNGTNGVPRTNGTDGESPTNGTDGVPLTNGVNGVSHANGTSGGPLTNGTYGDGRARETNQVAGTIAMAQHDGPTDYATLHGGLPLPMHASLGCKSWTRQYTYVQFGFSAEARTQP